MTLVSPTDFTCQRLAFYARQRPDLPAISNGQTVCSYRGLAIHVLQIKDALIGISLRRGQVVGIETGDRFLHLLLLLACEALGVTTISLAPFELTPRVNLGRLCDRILSSDAVSQGETVLEAEAESEVSADGAAKTFMMTRDWLVRAFMTSIAEDWLAAPEPTPDPDLLVRLIKSSGTTGLPKVMGMTHWVQQRTLMKNLRHVDDRIAAHIDYLCLYPFSVRGSHSRALMTLQLGGTIHFDSMDNVWSIIAAGSVNYLLLVAGDLQTLLRATPADPGGPFDVHIDVIGAAVAAAVRADAARLSTRPLLVTYGANEVHHVSVVDACNVGTLFPGARIRIADEAGRPVAPGQTGLIQVRSDTMTDGYVGGSDTEAAFADGWYHTRDIGFQPSASTLVVVGRADDMLNVGGMKVPPGPVEEQIRAIAGILDVAVVQTLDQRGREILLVAVETGADDHAVDFRPLISPIIQQYASAYVFLPLAVFPRTETGKIRRENIQTAYRQTLAGSA